MKKYVILLAIFTLYIIISYNHDNILVVENKSYQKLIYKLDFDKDRLKNKPNEENIIPSIIESTANNYVNVINNIRISNNLNSLIFDNNLKLSSDIRSHEISTYFSHVRPNGFSYDTIINYDNMCSGENIALGYETINDAIDGWMNSEGHRANILNPSYTRFSISQYNINDVSYYDMLFTC